MMKLACADHYRAGCHIGAKPMFLNITTYCVNTRYLPNETVKKLAKVCCKSSKTTNPTRRLVLSVLAVFQYFQLLPKTMYAQPYLS